MSLGFGFSWHAAKPRGVRVGQAYAEGNAVYRLKSSKMSDLIARCATAKLAKLFALAFNVDRATK